MGSVLELEAVVDETVARVCQKFKDDAKLGGSSNFSYHTRYVKGFHHTQSVRHGPLELQHTDAMCMKPQYRFCSVRGQASEIHEILHVYSKQPGTLLCRFVS